MIGIASRTASRRSRPIAGLGPSSAEYTVQPAEHKPNQRNRRDESKQPHAFYLLRYKLRSLYTLRKKESRKSGMKRMPSPVDFISGPNSLLTSGNFS